MPRILAPQDAVKCIKISTPINQSRLTPPPRVEIDRAVFNVMNHKIFVDFPLLILSVLSSALQPFLSGNYNDVEKPLITIISNYLLFDRFAHSLLKY